VGVLIQVNEFLIIGGAAFGAMVIANPMSVIKGTFSGVLGLLKPNPFSHETYSELLQVLYEIFQRARKDGLVGLEAHIEEPDKSDIFTKFPHFSGHTAGVALLSDTLKVLLTGAVEDHNLSEILDIDLDQQYEAKMHVPHALSAVSDAMPGFGIVAAVLGVITTMGSISEPPEVLGKLIGAALVGTFFGVLVSYGFLAPIASAIKGVDEADGKYFQCMKAGLLAHMQGYPPAVSVEFARKVLLSTERPNFYEVEQAVSALPPV
jgi:chemotaxis protein MotA